jgi:hypothetical protein
VTLNRSNVARGRQHLPELTFVAVCAVIAAVGCGGDDSSTTNPVGTTAGTGVAGSVGAAGTVSAVAGTGTAAVAGTGASAAAGTGAAAAAGTGAAAAAGTGAAAGGAVTLSMVYDTVYVTNCAVCHGMMPSDNTNGKLGMIRNKDQFFAALVGKPTQGSQCMGKGTYIVPGSPATSILVQKVSTTPPCGVEMPVGGMLMASDVKLITDWVSAGALNN